MSELAECLLWIAVGAMLLYIVTYAVSATLDVGRHAHRSPRLAPRLARIGVGLACAVVELRAAFVVGDPWLGIALIMLASWNIGLTVVGLVTIRHAAPASSEQPR